MKKEAIKEIRKYFLDISKILLTIAIITPYFKNEKVSIIAIFLSIVIFAIGAYLTNKGAKDE